MFKEQESNPGSKSSNFRLDTLQNLKSLKNQASKTITNLKEMKKIFYEDSKISVRKKSRRGKDYLRISDKKKRGHKNDNSSKIKTVDFSSFKLGKHKEPQIIKKRE